MKKFLLLLFSFSVYGQVNTQNIEIVRDDFGVPHIFGKTDAEVAYGLAWAHAEDDFKTIQQTMLAGKGMLGKYLGKDGAPIDYVVGLLRCRELAKEKINTLSPEFTKVAQGYLDGLNSYARQHPEEVLVKKSFPASMEDYLSSVALSLSVISGVDSEIKKILSRNIEPSEDIKGSNAFAIAPWKTTTGESFLNINSHQPLEGPVAWYEAHLHSEEGWNIIGGLFPGGCVIFHGTNENLGWAHTVNHQDKIDVYRLSMKGKKSNKYMFDGQWLKLGKKKVPLKVKLGWITLPLSKKAYWSKYGATLKTKLGVYSIRFGANQELRGLEEWYRMNKAKNFTEFYSAMKMVAIPGFNTVYADNRDTIFYVSNGMIPIRNPEFNWKGVLPGNTSKTLWTQFHGLEDLPQYLNPSSGYLYNTNNSVFHASAPENNLDPKSIDSTMGYPLTVNNRSARFEELINGYDKLSFEDFKQIKYDNQYPSSYHFPINLNIIQDIDPKRYPEIAEELIKIQTWNRKADIDSEGAALFSAFIYEVSSQFEGHLKGKVLSESEAVKILKKVKSSIHQHYGSSRITLGQVQKLARGNKILPIWGLPDVLTAMYTAPYENGTRKGIAGESYIQLVRFKRGQLPRISSIINYGASNHPESPHYSDQMELFIHQKLKPMSLLKADVMKNATRVYHPK